MASRLAQLQKGPGKPESTVQDVLKECCSSPYPTLAEEAQQFLEAGPRAGSSAWEGPTNVTETAWPSDPDAPGVGTLQVFGLTWVT